MSWDVLIAADREQSVPLGKRDDVIAQIEAAFPAVILRQVRATPLPGKLLADLSAAQRANLPRAYLEGRFQAEAYSIEFRMADSADLFCINAQVRGNGDPVPAFAALCLPNGWLVVDADADGQPVVDLLSGDRPPGWDEFHVARDKAMAWLKSQDPKG